MLKIKPSFNRLSRLDRTVLKIAALTNNSLDFIKSDVGQHPYKRSLYTGYVGLLGLTFLIPGGKITMAAGTYLLLQTSSPWARRAKKSLADAFDEDKVLDQFDQYIVPRYTPHKRPGRYQVERAQLYRDSHCRAWATLKNIWRRGGDDSKDQPDSRRPDRPAPSHG